MVAHIFTLLLAPFASKLVNHMRDSESLNIRKNSEIDDILLRRQLEPKQFKNNLIMFEAKPQFEFCRLITGSNFEVDAQKNQSDV